MFPLLRAGLVALFVSLALAHVVELFGVVRVFRLDATPIERAIFVDAHLGAIRLGMVAGLVAAASALVAAFGPFWGRGGHERVSGPGPWVLSVSLLAFSALGVASTLTLTRALLPLADSALRSGEFTVAAPGSTASAFVTMANVVVGMGRAAVLDELSRAESLALVAHLAVVPLAEAAVAVGLLLFVGRLRRAGLLEALAAAALLALVGGAGFALVATAEGAIDRGAVELSVVCARLGAAFLLGALLFSVESLRSGAVAGSGEGADQRPPSVGSEQPSNSSAESGRSSLGSRT